MLKKSKNSYSINEINDDTPVYPISVAAKLLNVHMRTIIKYEKEGLLKPSRNTSNNHRLFSKADLKWVECIRTIVHKEGINIKSIKYMLTRIPCWALNKCSDADRQKCSAYQHFTKPCWEVLDGICRKDSQATCDNCDVYKYAKQQRDYIMTNSRVLTEG